MTKEWAKALLSAVILAVMVVPVLRLPEWRTEAVQQENEVPDIADLLFSTYVVPFEVLSVLLLGALLGALYLGSKTRREPGAPR